MSACALLIGAVACAASIYQLHNASILMSAQTWPYVTVGWHIGTDESEIVVVNDGQGSAIAVDLCYCSVLDRCWSSAIDELPREVAHCDESSNLTMPDLKVATTPAETGG